VRWVLIDGREIGLPALRRWYVVHVALAAPALALIAAPALHRAKRPPRPVPAAAPTLDPNRGP
jgi:hypothetical protein